MQDSSTGQHNSALIIIQQSADSSNIDVDRLRKGKDILFSRYVWQKRSRRVGNKCEKKFGIRDWPLIILG